MLEERKEEEEDRTYVHGKMGACGAVVLQIILIEPSGICAGAGLVSPHFGHPGRLEPNTASSDCHGPLKRLGLGCDVIKVRVYCYSAYMVK